MFEYHIMIDDKLLLTVEVGDTPMTLHLTGKGSGNNNLTFTYTGDTTPGAANHRKAHARSTHATFTAPAKVGRLSLDGTTMMTFETKTLGGATVEYVDPKGTGM